METKTYTYKAMCPEMPKFKERDGHYEIVNRGKMVERTCEAKVTWVGACFGGIAHISLSQGERIVTVFLCGGHYLNWTVVSQLVDDEHEIVKGPAFTREAKENGRLLREAIQKFMHPEAWEAIKGEFEGVAA